MSSSKHEPHWNLPSYGGTDNGNLPSIMSPGRWQELNNVLGDVGEALRINADSVEDIADVKSVPAIWGHIIAFRNALYNEKDSLHAHAVSQWRGLLTLIGLQKIQSSVYSIKAKEARAEVFSSDGLARIAGKFRPVTSIDQEADVKTIHLLSIHTGDERSTLVGIATPDTLVAPGRNVASVSIPNAGWFTNGPSCPVASNAGLSPEQELSLAAFVDELVKAVKASQPAPSGAKLRPVLLELLKAFARDLRASAGEASRTEPRLVPDIRTLAVTKGVLAALNQIYEPGEISGDVTDLLVNMRTDLAQTASLKGFILADPAFAEQHKRRADRVTLWRERRLSEIANPKSFEAIRKEALASDFLLVRPQDIFNEVYVPFSSQAATAHGEDLAKGLLPLKPIVLMMFNPDDLRSRLKLVEERKGRWVFELTLDVVASDGLASNAKHVIRKEYMTSDAMAEAGSKDCGLAVANAAQNFWVEAPASLAAWPNFRHRNWRWNFLYFQAEKWAAIPMSGLSGEIIRRDLANLGRNEDRLGQLAKWSTLNNTGESARWPGTWVRERSSPQARPWFERLAINQRSQHGGEDQTEIQRCDVPFEAVTFRVEASSDLVGDNAAKTYFAGIGLLPSLVAAPLREDRASLAIDFGTTNTTVYYQLDGNHECRFKNRLRQFKNADAAAGDSPFANFMPATEVAQPFGTLLADRNLRWHGDETPSWKSMGSPEPILWQSHIMFGEDFQKILGKFWPGDGGEATIEMDDSRLRSGFKWSTEPEQRGAIGRFLTHCSTLSLAELCANGVPPQNVDWRFSFPTAMNSEDANDFYERVRAVVQDLHDPGDAANSSSFERPTVYSATEAVAAAVYFREEFKTQMPRSYIVLDIGGGTTDVGIWQRGQQVWSGSFLLAGGDLMLDFIAKNEKFLKVLSINSQDMLGYIGDRLIDALPQLERADKPSDKTIAFLVNSSKFRHRFEEAAPDISGRDEVRKLYAGARLMLGGLLYYIGLQVRGLLEHPENKNLIDTADFDSVRIAFAGRGSTLFFQMHNKGVNSRLAGTYAMFNSGRLQEDNSQKVPHPTAAPTDIRFSPVPKHEVALGMLHMTERELELSDSNPGTASKGLSDFMVSGEVISGQPDPDADNKSTMVLATEGVSEIANRFNGQRLGKQDLHQFDRFLSELHANTGLALHLSKTARGTLEQALGKEAEAWIGVTPLQGSESLRRPEPPFIRLLRESMRLLYLEPGEKVLKDEVITFKMTR